VLIAYRLWTRQYTVRDSRKVFGFTREAAIIGESGAIYSTNLIIIIATYATDSNSFNVFLDMVSESLPVPHLVRRHGSLTANHEQACPIIGIAVSVPFCQIITHLPLMRKICLS
jgi:hypothetical protein